MDQAERIYKQILNQDPRCHQAIHGLGLLMFQRNKLSAARDLLRHAIQIDASDPDYHFNFGEVLYAAKAFQDAKQAYQQAIDKNPKEADYYFGLGNVLFELEEFDQAGQSYRRALRYKPKDPEIHNNLSNALTKQGKLKEAKNYLKQAIAYDNQYSQAYLNLALVLNDLDEAQLALEMAHKGVALSSRSIDAYLILARVLREQSRLEEAEKIYQNVLNAEPDCFDALFGYGLTLELSDQIKNALQQYHKACHLDPKHLQCQIRMSNCYIRLLEFSKAESIARSILETDPDNARAMRNLGVCLQTRGDFEQATQVYRKALAIDPDLVEIMSHMTSIGGYQASDDEVGNILSRIKRNNLPEEKKYYAHFSLGKIYDRRKEYDSAFEHFQKANEIRSQLQPFDMVGHIDYVDRIIRVFDDDLFTNKTEFGIDNRQLVFIVGMPRSGSTLLEQILASHAEISAIGEHPEMLNIVRDLPTLIQTKEKAPECCHHLHREQSKIIAQRYIGSIPKNAIQSERVVDKMLGNFLRLGVIALLFPNARVIHSKRNPMDTCWSCFTQDFTHGLRFTNNLKHLGIFYNAYSKLMDHWHRVLPLPIKDVSYESLVENQESVARDVVSFSGLEWDDNCLNHHKTERNVATASFWQVRQPIYKKSVEKWRNYEPYLQDLVQIIG